MLKYHFHPDSNDLPSAKLNPRSGGVLIHWKQVEVEREREWCTLVVGRTYFALHIWFNRNRHRLLLLGHRPTLRRRAAALAVAVDRSQGAGALSLCLRPCRRRRGVIRARRHARPAGAAVQVQWGIWAGRLHGLLGWRDAGRWVGSRPDHCDVWAGRLHGLLGWRDAGRWVGPRPDHCDVGERGHHRSPLRRCRSHLGAPFLLSGSWRAGSLGSDSGMAMLRQLIGRLATRPWSLSLWPPLWHPRRYSPGQREIGLTWVHRDPLWQLPLGRHRRRHGPDWRAGLTRWRHHLCRHQRSAGRRGGLIRRLHQDPLRPPLELPVTEVDENLRSANLLYILFLHRRHAEATPAAAAPATSARLPYPTLHRHRLSARTLVSGYGDASRDARLFFLDKEKIQDRWAPWRGRPSPFLYPTPATCKPSLIRFVSDSGPPLFNQ